jgi:hypothetical protein
MKTRKNSFFVVLLACLLLSAAYAHPGDSDHKKPYALIFGTVYGTDDHPAYGVKVKIRRADQKKAKWELMSDHSGEFAQRVPAGEADYVISADKADDLKVHIENDERKDVSVHLSR